MATSSLHESSSSARRPGRPTSSIAVSSDKVSIKSPPTDTDVLCLVEIPVPHSMLRNWYSLDAPDYIELLNNSIPDRIVVVKKDSQRLASRLACVSAHVRARLRKLTGRARMSYQSSSTSVEVRLFTCD